MLTLIQYNSEEHKTIEDLSPKEAAKLVKADFVNWIDVDITEQSLVDETILEFVKEFKVMLLNRANKILIILEVSTRGDHRNFC